MNLIITKRCNKGCPYCFASSSRNSSLKDDMDMSFETFVKLLDKIDDRTHPKLLGGEPTSHPNFSLFIDELVKRRKDFTIISNFLFTDEIRDVIIKASNEVKISFLINSSNLNDVKGRYDTFVKNYNTIYNHLYVRDLEVNISC